MISPRIASEQDTHANMKVGASLHRAQGTVPYAYTLIPPQTKCWVKLLHLHTDTIAFKDKAISFKRLSPFTVQLRLVR